MRAFWTAKSLGKHRDAGKRPVRAGQRALVAGARHAGRGPLNYGFRP